MASNPNWNITQAAANELGRAAGTLDNLAVAVQPDPRYSYEYDSIRMAADALRRYQKLVTDYLAVQGT